MKVASQQLPQQIAQHLRAVHFGGNWTSVNIRDSLEGITWQQATTKIGSLNTIAVLLFHCNYYISAVMKVLQEQPLEAKDTFSFDLPPMRAEDDWNSLKEKTFTDAEAFASLVEQLPEERLWETFTDEKYGTWYRNLVGIIEHTHYHLGQIVLLKKLIQQQQGE